MTETIYNSKLWMESLAENSKYAENHSEQVEILRTSFKNTRRKAEYVAGFIQQSQPGLTLHDITHLDALWETAVTVGGDSIHLNPIEAYVFGCAVLFHDLGMALVLWDEQLPLLKQSKEYKDTLFYTYRNYLGRTPEAEDYEHVPDNVLQTSISALLRQRHAFKAKLLPSHHWNNNGENIYLIENEDLRTKLGEIIGIVAESHWWDVERIRSDFEKRQKTAAPTTFPIEWTIDNIKLACLLRLADFIHIDDRRATDLGLAILNPSGISLHHWTFQKKLNRAFRENGKERLTFQSHVNFKYEEHQAWWLAFNTIRAIDLELRAVDNLLSDLDMQRFAAKGVNGISSPQRMSAFIKTQGWEPADTQYRVSNIQTIIEKLGGSQLYGERPDVPLRELIQNATDAIKAKKFYNKAYRGIIHVRYYNNAGTDWLEVEDNGIGMSKSALIYGLLDFGNSFWESSQLIREHPGLLSGGFHPTGQFGIGFFSVFMVADFIQIISKSIAQGSQTYVLEIGQGLSSNPILQIANENEERIESGTLVRISCKKAGLIERIIQQLGWRHADQLAAPLTSICQRIAPTLPVDLVCTFENEGPALASEADDWKSIDPVELLSRITNDESVEGNIDLTDLQTLAKFIRPIYNEQSNEMIARATILPLPGRGSDFEGIAKITVGGLAQAPIKNITGLWLGKNSVVSRNFATPICTHADLLPWLNEQNKLIVSDEAVPENDKVAASNIICSLGLIPNGLPITFIKGRWFTYEQVADMDHGDYVLIESLTNGDSAFRGIVGTGDKIYASVGNPVAVGMINQVNGTQTSWIDDLPGKLSGVDNYDKFVKRFSMLGVTVRAIAASWGISELTGSATKGRNNYFHYYHCSSACGVRYRAELVNECFITELQKYKLKRPMGTIYARVVHDQFHNMTRATIDHRRKLVTSVTEQNTRLSKARELLLMNDIDGDDYKIMKKDCEDRIVRLEAELRELSEKPVIKVDLDEIVDRAVFNFENIDSIYVKADIIKKREIIGSMFPEKIVFDGKQHRTGKINEAMALSHLITSKLKGKKNGAKSNFLTLPHEG